MNGNVVSVSLKPRKMSDTELHVYIDKSTAVDTALMQEKHNVDRQQLKGFDITKTVQSSIEVVPGGVVGDKHFAFELIPTREHEVVLISIETLNKHCTDFKTLIGPGQLGENILTNGIDLNNLPKGAILHIGKTAKLQVVARRSFCFKFINAIGVENVQPGQRFNMNEVGLQACVLDSGTIYPGDPIRVKIPRSATALPRKHESIPLARFRKISLTTLS
jgi:MOSC domain-containing protein YiiM